MLLIIKVIYVFLFNKKKDDNPKKTQPVGILFCCLFLKSLFLTAL